MDQDPGSAYWSVHVEGSCGFTLLTQINSEQEEPDHESCKQDEVRSEADFFSPGPTPTSS